MNPTMNAQEIDGNTKLHLASKSPEEDISDIEKLLGFSKWHKLASLLKVKSSMKYDCDVTNEVGETPLFLACRDQRREIIAFLLQRGADCRKANNAGGTPLHWLAVVPEYYDLIETVIERGADVNAQYTGQISDYESFSSGLTSQFRLKHRRGSPLQWAVVAGNVTAARLLAQHGANIEDNSSGISPLRASVYFADPSLLSALLDSKPHSYNVDSRVLYELVWDSSHEKRCLAQTGDKEMVEVLQILQPHMPCSNLDDINAFFRFTVAQAVRAASLPVLQGIIKCLEDCYTSCGTFDGQVLSHQYWRDQRLLRDCITRNDPTVLNFIIEKGAELAPEPLHFLPQTSEAVECAKVLLAHGCDIEMRNHSGLWRPFGYAVLHGDEKLADFLRDTLTAEQLAEEISADAQLGPGESVLKGPCTLMGLVLRYIKASDFRLRGLEYLFSLPAHYHAAQFITAPKSKTTVFHEILDESNWNRGFFNHFNTSSVFRFLLAKFNDPEQHVTAKDISDMTPLFIAAWLAKVEECYLLFEAGADVNAVAERGRTPLE